MKARPVQSGRGPCGQRPWGARSSGRCLQDRAELGAGLLGTCAPAPEVPPTTCCGPPKQREGVRHRGELSEEKLSYWRRKMSNLPILEEEQRKL